MGLTVLGMMVMGAASFFDIKKKKIPLYVILLAAAISTGCAVGGLADGTGTWEAIIRALLPGGFFLLLSIALKGSIGAGDGLLMMSMGPIFGFERLILGVTAAFFLSSLASVFMVALKKANRKTRLPFVPFLTAGMGAMLVML